MKLFGLTGNCSEEQQKAFVDALPQGFIDEITEQFNKRDQFQQERDEVTKQRDELQQKLDELEHENEELKQRFYEREEMETKKAIAKEFSLPERFIERIRGNNKKEWRKDAKALSELLPPQEPQAPP